MNNCVSDIDMGAERCRTDRYQYNITVDGLHVGVALFFCLKKQKIKLYCVKRPNFIHTEQKTMHKIIQYPVVFLFNMW